nr:ecdysone receptor A1 [Daphnia magna]
MEGVVISGAETQQQQQRIRLASSVLSVATIIKTEPRNSDSPTTTPLQQQQQHNSSSSCSSPSPSSASSIRRSRSRISTGGGSPLGSSPSPTSPSAAMHPISMSLLHSSSPSSSHHHHPHHPHQSFYGGGSTTPTLVGASASGSVHSPSPLKRSRHININNNNNNSSSSAMEEWLPSPGQMSVDSMSPPPPPSSSSMSMRADGLLEPGQQQQLQQQRASSNGHSTLPPSVISSSNGYSPSPMSTGSYEPPFSPGGGGGKLGREDLSPPGSVNGGGGYSVDSFTDAKKKKGPVPRQQEELCLVCGDRASGYHYNALTCEGCKGFFRRSITKNAVYQCKYGNGCDIDMYMRRKCQECRLKKCLTVGMRPECVVPEYQCAVKREAKKAQKEKDRPNSSSLGSPDMKEPEIKAIHQQQQQQQQQQMQQQQQQLQQHIHVLDEKPMIVCGPANGGVSNGSPVKPLSPEQEELINRLVYFQEEFDQPSEEDLRKISTSGIHESDADAKFKHITEMTILTVQLTVEFSKRLPGFDTLLREDQITLLKACSSEVMMLRCARRYDANTDSIVFANNLPYTRESYNMAGVGDTADSLFRFGKTMSLMKVDNAEYALLTAIVIFSERPGLVEARKVEKIQEIYLEALQAYVMNHRVRPMTEFAKLLSVLTELRTLGNLNSEMCFSLKLKNKKLPPFLAEIWDVHS